MTNVKISALPSFLPPTLSLHSYFLASLPQVSANIALEAFLIRPSNFLGLSCMALQRPLSSAALPLTDSQSHTDKDLSRERDAVGESLLNFKCHTVNNSGSPASQLSKVINGVKLSKICYSVLLLASVGKIHQIQPEVRKQRSFNASLSPSQWGLFLKATHFCIFWHSVQM